MALAQSDGDALRPRRRWGSAHAQAWPLPGPVAVAAVAAAAGEAAGLPRSVGPAASWRCGRWGLSDCGRR